MLGLPLCATHQFRDVFDEAVEGTLLNPLCLHKVFSRVFLMIQGASVK